MKQRAMQVGHQRIEEYVRDGQNRVLIDEWYWADMEFDEAVLRATNNEWLAPSAF